jgi:acyl-CoA synthetase (AMP-forming)/AMP-acid ligase II
MGEIVMRGNTVMTGYFRDPEGTAEAFTGGGAVQIADGGREAMVRVNCCWRVAGRVGWRQSGGRGWV